MSSYQGEEAGSYDGDIGSGREGLTPEGQESAILCHKLQGESPGRQEEARRPHPRAPSLALRCWPVPAHEKAAMTRRLLMGSPTGAEGSGACLSIRVVIGSIKSLS